MDPTVDLETLIRHLAGREPADAGHLNDSTSPSSQFFDEIRRRTRSLLADHPEDDSQTARPGMDQGRVDPDGKRIPVGNGRQLASWLAFLALVGAGLAIQAAWIDRSARVQSRAQLDQTVAALRPLLADVVLRVATDPADTDRAAAIGLAAPLANLAAKLDALQFAVNARSGPETLDRPPEPHPVPPTPAGPPPNTGNITADLAAIRRELASSEAATTRQIQEMRTVLHELNTVVRRVLSRPQAPTNNGVPPAVLAVAVQALIHNLQHPSAQVRGEAVEQLIRIGAPARSAIPALQQRLGQEPDLNIRAAIETAMTVLSSN